MIEKLSIMNVFGGDDDNDGKGRLSFRISVNFIFLDCY